MFYKYEIIIYFLFLLLLCKVNHSIYLTSGIKSLNKFLYYSRITQYYNQNKIKACSFSDGPNCYFTEYDYAKHYTQTNNENKKEIINNEWVKFYSKIPKNNYKNIMQNLVNYTTNYINLYSKEIDKEQNPQNEILQVLITFDAFDIDTKKKDIYLQEKLGKIFFNEEIIADIKGNLKLSYDRDITEKELNLKYKDYPSTTYGIIESEFVSISFRGRLFICNYLYIKAHDEKSKSEQILFYGYLGDQLIYSYTYTDNQKRKEKWLKVTFPAIISADKLVISGPYDIDNIAFTFPNSINIDQNEIYSKYNYKNIKILVSNDDI